MGFRRPPQFWSLWLLGAAIMAAVTLGARATAHFPGDVTVARKVQALDLPGLGAVLHRLNQIGGGVPAAVVTALVAAGFLLRRRYDLLRVFVAASLLRLTTLPVKVLTNRPRPPDELVHVMERASDPSFPSGHAVSAVLLYGTLAVLIEFTFLPRRVRRGAQVACLAMVLLIGLARVYSGAHWPSDVLGGYLWGGLSLALVVHAGRIAGLPARGRQSPAGP